MLDSVSTPAALSTPARRLAVFPAELSFDDIPTSVLHRGKLLILDALGCGLASNAYAFSDVAAAGAAADRCCG